MDISSKSSLQCYTINPLEAVSLIGPCSYRIQIKSDHQCVLEQLRVAVWSNAAKSPFFKLTVSKYFTGKKNRILNVFFVSFFFHFFSSHFQPWSAVPVVFPTMPESLVMFCFTMLGSQIDLYILNRMPDSAGKGGGVSKEISGSVLLPVWRYVSRQWLSQWLAKC